MLPILAGFIAMAIGDRPALALGLVGGMMAANGKSGFLGALLAGFVAGYLILGLRKLCDKLPEALEKIAPVLIYPVVGILVMGLLMTFIVEPIMLLFTRHYPARCFGMKMPKSRDIPREFMRLA